MERTPHCRKVRYGVTDAPALHGVSDGAGSFDVDPTLIEFIFYAARGDRPASVSVSVTGWRMRHGERIQPGGPEGEVYVYFSGDPDGWPEWLAEEQKAADALLNCTTEEKSAICGECDHAPASHSEGEDPVSPGVCAECPDGEETHDYLPSRGHLPQERGSLMTNQPARPETDDPRVLALAQARQQLAHNNAFGLPCPAWDGLTRQEQGLSLAEARNWLHAAMNAGLVADRATTRRELADRADPANEAS